MPTNRGELMDLSYVKKLIKMLSDSGVDEIEIEEEGKRVKIVKHSRNSIATGQPLGAGFGPAAVPPSAMPAAVPVASAAVPPTQNLHEIKSPIVGTFYRAPAPDAAPFIELGSQIGPGTVLCIVEAMKLMNEIESDVSGKIAKILVENGQPVEYDQALFLVEM
jgi:acetyl-CoA carboxylase biotin carboxyl carrier protein